MAFLDYFRSKKPTPVTFPKRTVPNVTMHKGRVEALEKTWYSVNRGFLNSPNQEIRYQLEKTRDLSRLLCSIDPYASKYLELLSVYVVGANGMQLSPRVYDRNGVLDTETNNTIKALWDEWCEEASYDGRYSFNELEQLGIRTIGRDGEALFRIVTGKSVNRFGIALHPIDPALLDISYSVRISDTNYVAMGVEYSGAKPVAYHIWNRYQDELVRSGMTGRIRERIPVDEIIHVFDDDYGNLVRGIPWTTPAIKTLARLHEFLDAHLKACQVAAAAPLVMTSTDGTSTPDYMDVGITNGVNADGTTSTSYAALQPTITLDHSQILELPANKKLETLAMEFPKSGFDVAVKTYLQGVAAALQISYASLTSDGSKDSFSTVRHGSILERDHWKQVQSFYKTRFHKKVYKAWLDAVLLSSALDLPGQPEDYSRHDFISRGFSWIDPLKDMKAYAEGLQHGFYTHSQIAAEMGQNWQENIDVLAAEREYAKAKGVVLPSEVPPPQTPEVPLPENAPQQETPNEN